MLADTLLQLVFSYVSRSLFNTDRLTFGMHMTRHLQPGLFKGEEWSYFLGEWGRVGWGGGVCVCG